MKASYVTESKKCISTKDSGQPATTKSGSSTAGNFCSATPANRALTLRELQARAEKLSVLGLKILSDTIRKRGRGYFSVMTQCLSCLSLREKDLRNLEKGFSKKCQCLNVRHYRDPRANVLGQRFEAMRQRCNRDSHWASSMYKGRGVKVLFKSRRHFITWAIATWPDQDFKGLEFDRVDNDGDYSESNLRLVTRSENMLNRRLTESINISTARNFL